MYTPAHITGSRLTYLDKNYLSQWLTWVDEKLLEFRYEKRQPEVDGSFLIKLTAKIPLSRHIAQAMVILYKRYDWDVEHMTQSNKNGKVTHILKFMPPAVVNEEETIIQIDTTTLENMRSIAEYRIGYVYLLKAENGLYKIGRSRTPKIRISQITKAIAPFDIQIIHTAFHEDCIRAEAELHEKFKSKRTRGEWFELSDEEVKAVIEHSYRAA